MGLLALGVNCPEEHTRGHGCGVRLDIRENFFSEREAKPWNRLSKEVVYFTLPSPEVFKQKVDVAFGGRDYLAWWGCGESWTRCS